MKRLLRWLVNGIVATALVMLTILMVYALQARRLMDLQPWQSDVPALELTAAQMDERFTLADYLKREDALFAQTRRHIAAAIPTGQMLQGNRYWPGSRNSQWRFAADWNRSFQLEPRQLRGGALLLHGLTDSPYSVRPIALALQARGYYVLALRVPGHGTVPAALTKVHWEDWLAASRVGARAVRERIGPGRPFVMVGYSNGAAVTVMNQLDALRDASLPRADRIVLVSPMIGISPTAGLSRFLNSLSFIPFFEKSAWTDVQPEYNPFKYNSFPLNAALQGHQLTGAIADRIATLKADGRLANMPPILAFQSVLDFTVSTPAVVHTLFGNLPANGSELVLFDINRGAVLENLVKPGNRALLGIVLGHGPHDYRLTVVGNTGPESGAAATLSTAPGGVRSVMGSTGIQYPPDIYSLSHIALPFPCNDPVYGLQPDPAEDYGIRLGKLPLSGERDALSVPVDQLARIGCNPFYPYLERHMLEWLGAASPEQATP